MSKAFAQLRLAELFKRCVEPGNVSIAVALERFDYRGRLRCLTPRFGLTAKRVAQDVLNFDAGRVGTQRADVFTNQT